MSAGSRGEAFAASRGRAVALLAAALSLADAGAPPAFLAGSPAPVTAVPEAAGDRTAAPPEHRRPPEQTYLTFPEWSLVFGPAEYADYLQNRPPSLFPYLGQVRQFWEGYGAVWRRTNGKYPFNLGYHVMVMVIGTSTTFEYSVKAAYETLVGRLAEMTRTHGPTSEERFAGAVARRYVDFIRIWPWYEFDFKGELSRLWSTTGFTGPDMIRKWERKYALTAELGSKAVYGWVIKKATKIAYEDPMPVTAVLLDHLPDGAMVQLPRLEVLRHLPDGSVLVTVPRYAPFDAHATALARDGAAFLEIAGNRSTTPILAAVLAPAGWRPETAGEVVLTQPILTRPGVRRFVIAVPIASLASALNGFARNGCTLEHVYDY